MQAQVFDSKFSSAHDTWNSVGVASDGTVYYILSSAKADIGGKMFCLDPGSQQVRELGDLTEICKDPPNHIVQGKSHVNLIEDPSTGDIHFSTHVGHYQNVMIGDVETEMVPDGKIVPLPEGRGLYPGGCYIKYSPKSAEFAVLGRAPDHQGIISSTVDFERKRFFCLVFPSGKFGYLLPGEEMVTLLDFNGRGAGEAVHPEEGPYRLICRAPVVEPKSGRCFFTNTLGQVLYFDADDASAGVRVLLEGAEGLERDYLAGMSKPTEPGNAGFHWRQAFWDPSHRGGSIVGLHGNTGYVFELTLGERPRLDLLDRVTSMPSKRSGMADQFTYGTLGFAIEGTTVYYLTGAPIYKDGKRLLGAARSAKGEVKGLENLHLVTYELTELRYTDHGPIFLADGTPPTWVNSIGVGKDGFIYFLAKLPNELTELLRVANPLAKK